MIKNILVVLAVLFVTSTHAMAYNNYYYYYYYYSMSNPANPISRLNPFNPVSPLYHRHMNSHSKAKTSYKGYYRQTRSYKLRTIINRCLMHNGGTACLYKVKD